MPKMIRDKVLSWLPEELVEESALNQLQNMAQLPFIHKYIGAMPDCHFGKGASIGSVVPTVGAIVPGCVGVDIGCGMIALKTPFTRGDLPEDLSDIRKAIEQQIPLNAGRYNNKVKKTADPKVAELESLADTRVAFYDALGKNWRKQLGTLGSGNHFIELVLDEEDCVWAFLHSGSRGIGNRIAIYHTKVAKDLMQKYFITLPDPELAYLVEGTPEFDAYFTDMMWAQEFARLNREEMIDRVVKILAHRLGEFEPLEMIQCHHNYTTREHHHGKNVLVTRKGAIQAREGTMGLIPGSMGTRSYVVRGQGNAASFHTAPHGAGRRMSRGAAFKKFTMEDFDRDMAGIEARRNKSLLDELPGAYKDIDMVMEQSKDLVEVVHTFRQVLNVKGN